MHACLNFIYYFCKNQFICNLILTQIYVTTTQSIKEKNKYFSTKLNIQTFSSICLVLAKNHKQKHFWIISHFWSYIYDQHIIYMLIKSFCGNYYRYMLFNFLGFSAFAQLKFGPVTSTILRDPWVLFSLLEFQMSKRGILEKIR